MTFQAQLSQGKIGESLIAKWFNRRGYNVLPVYETELAQGKGPRLFSPGKQLIAPDMLIFKTDNTFWIEAKHKTAFSWHRITEQWVTGIDVRHYKDYREISKFSPWPVWLLFLQTGGQAKDSPPNSPSGLFGNDLKYLSSHENHRSGNWGREGMVYWSISHLKELASLREM